MTRFEKDLRSWARGTLHQERQHGIYLLTPTYIWQNDRAVGLRFRSPLGKKCKPIILFRGFARDGGRLDSDIDPAVDFKGKNFHIVQSDDFDYVVGFLNNLQRPRHLPKWKADSIGHAVKFIAKFTGDEDHPILGAPPIARAVYALNRRSKKKVALCVWEVKRDFQTMVESKLCSTMDEAIMLKMQHNGAVYAL